MTKLLINLTTAQDSPDRTTVAFVIANAGVAAGQEVTVFLNVEAVRLATPGYLSPASHEGRSEAPDARQDQYALGVVLHQMLYGHRPGGAPLDGNAASSPAPSALRGLLSRCLEEQPSRRYAELSELIDAGLGLLRSHGSGDEVEHVRRLVALLEQPAA